MLDRVEQARHVADGVVEAAQAVAQLRLVGRARKARQVRRLFFLFFLLFVVVVVVVVVERWGGEIEV